MLLCAPLFTAATAAAYFVRILYFSSFFGVVHELDVTKGKSYARPFITIIIERECQ